MNLAERLTYLRKESGFTQLTLAEKVNVSRQAVSRWESGTAIPSTESLKILSNIYGVSVDYLLNGSGEESCTEKEVPQEVPQEPARETLQKPHYITWKKLFIAVVCVLLILAGLVGASLLQKKPEKVSINEIPERSWASNPGEFSIDW